MVDPDFTTEITLAHDVGMYTREMVQALLTSALFDSVRVPVRILGRPDFQGACIEVPVMRGLGWSDAFCNAFVDDKALKIGQLLPSEVQSRRAGAMNALAGVSVG
jgi:hypothetical protein